MVTSVCDYTGSVGSGGPSDRSRYKTRTQTEVWAMFSRPVGPVRSVRDDTQILRTGVNRNCHHLARATNGSNPARMTQIDHASFLPRAEVFALPFGGQRCADTPRRHQPHAVMPTPFRNQVPTPNAFTSPASNPQTDRRTKRLFVWMHGQLGAGEREVRPPGRLPPDGGIPTR